jgi:hypothetical protein
MQKLSIYTIIMAVLSLGGFYLVNWYTKNLIWSGISAAIVANLVLIGFVISAFNEKDE